MKICISVKDAMIIGVEKGNADKNVENPVCAFSFHDDDGNRVKALLKGSVAKLAWDLYLKDRQTEDSEVEFEDGAILRKEVGVSFDGYIREERQNEVVLDKIENIVFKFVYSIMA